VKPIIIEAAEALLAENGELLSERSRLRELVQRVVDDAVEKADDHNHVVVSKAVFNALRAALTPTSCGTK
jgi:hypothetical protein